MQATLKILTGPEAGRIIHLKTGQVARFGRTEWSDFAFPYDHRLADIHFSIETTDDAVALTDHSDGAGVEVDGKPFHSGRLRSGQKIRAGQMVFAIATEQLFDTSGAGPVAVSHQPAPAAAAELAGKICKTVDLSEPAQGLLDDAIEILPYLEKLKAADLLVDAMRVLASWLRPRKAVSWGVVCVESVCAARLDTQAALLAQVRDWVQAPTEENRQGLVSAAESLDGKLPAVWLARAAGWSGGSLAPPGLPVVPPAAHLTAQALIAALLLAAVFVDPAKTADNYRQFIEQGEQLSQTTLEWEAEGE